MKSTSLKYDLENQIDNYVNGRLSQDQIDNLWVHLIENDLVDLAKTTATVKKIASESDQEVINKKVIGRIIPVRMIQYAAAAVIIMLLSVFMVTNFYLNESANGFQPLQALEYSIVRSGATESEFHNNMQTYVAEAIRGNNDAAILSLSKLAESTDNESLKAEALMNIGIIQYNSGNVMNAESMFLKIIAMNNIDVLETERALWYLANVQFKLGKNAEAAVSIQKVIEIDGAYSRVANHALSEIQ